LKITRHQEKGIVNYKLGGGLSVDVEEGMGKENKKYFSFDILLCNVVQNSERIIRIITP
jgi:hypothetical protein